MNEEFIENQTSKFNENQKQNYNKNTDDNINTEDSQMNHSIFIKNDNIKNSPNISKNNYNENNGIKKITKILDNNLLNRNSKDLNVNSNLSIETENINQNKSIEIDQP